VEAGCDEPTLGVTWGCGNSHRILRSRQGDEENFESRGGLPKRWTKNQGYKGQKKGVSGYLMSAGLEDTDCFRRNGKRDGGKEDLTFAIFLKLGLK